MTKAFFNWSGGKDSALALYELKQNPDYEITSLLTSVSSQYQRISMHGVRSELLDLQAESIGLPLIKMMIPENPTMEVYEKVMSETLIELKKQGVTHSVFGDIFLDDLRRYREAKLSELGLKGLFPLWQRPTKELIHEFIDLGFKTITTCVNEKYLDKSFAGRIIDRDFLKDLPANVDPCGENGEFHTFVFEGPIFKKSIPFQVGEIVYRKYNNPNQDKNGDVCKTDDPFATGFWYCDLLPG
ncbi:MAG: ATP-binding protein [Bacteroidetes bacterium]|nr:ATP-binding protein [Bacteroidota bacterium]